SNSVAFLTFSSGVAGRRTRSGFEPPAVRSGSVNALAPVRPLRTCPLYRLSDTFVHVGSFNAVPGMSTTLPSVLRSGRDAPGAVRMVTVPLCADGWSIDTPLDNF